jgi:hypothetical protein
MADAPGVHQLDEDLGALRMHRVGDLLPAGRLLGRENARDARIAQPFGNGDVPSVTIRPAEARCA